MGNNTLTFNPKPSFLNQLYRDVSNKLRMSITKKSKVPWMKAKELDIIVEVLIKHRPKRCLEWGSGFSTILFPTILSKDSSWVAIEHNADWFNFLQGEDMPKNVELNLVEADHYPYSDTYKDGSYDDFKTYIEKPTGKFDIIFIDGRARKHCLVKSLQLVNPNGIVILHDANRFYYHESFSQFKYQVFFEDHNTEWGGVWIGSMDQGIGEILNQELHKKLWEKHLSFHKLIGFNRFKK